MGILSLKCFLHGNQFLLSKVRVFAKFLNYTHRAPTGPENGPNRRMDAKSATTFMVFDTNDAVLLKMTHRLIFRPSRIKPV